MVRLELVELHLEVRRGEDVGEDHGVEVHGLLVAPQRQHVALLAGGRRLRGAALQLLLARSGGAGLVLRRLLPLAVAGAHGGAVVGHGGGAGPAGRRRPRRDRAGRDGTGRALPPPTADKMAAPAEVTPAPSGAEPANPRGAARPGWGEGPAESGSGAGAVPHAEGGAPRGGYGR